MLIAFLQWFTLLLFTIEDYLSLFIGTILLPPASLSLWRLRSSTSILTQTPHNWALSWISHLTLTHPPTTSSSLMMAPLLWFQQIKCHCESQNLMSTCWLRHIFFPCSFVWILRSLVNTTDNSTRVTYNNHLLGTNASVTNLTLIRRKPIGVSPFWPPTGKSYAWKESSSQNTMVRCSFASQ